MRYRNRENEIKIGKSTSDYGVVEWNIVVKTDVRCSHCQDMLRDGEKVYFCDCCQSFFCLGCKSWFIENHWCRSKYVQYITYFGNLIIEKKEE